MSRLRYDKSGRDRIAAAAGLSIHRDQRGPSAWEGHVGAGIQTHAHVTLVRDKNGSLQVSKLDRKRLNAWAAAIGYAFHQDAVAWHVPIYDGHPEHDNGVEMKFSRDLTHREFGMLYRRISKLAGHEAFAPAPTDKGFRVLNFTGMPNTEFHEVIIRAVEALPDNFGGSDATFISFRSDGNLVSNDWTRKETARGEGYKTWIGSAGSPDLQGRSEHLRTLSEGVNRRFARRYGLGPATLQETRAQT
jgi:hypothetical protein